MPPTAAAAAIGVAVAARFPGLKQEVSSCRKVSGTNVWSQHAYDNAVDIYPRNQAQGDRIHAFLREAKQTGLLPIGELCWKDMGGCDPAAHQDHIHVSGPKKSGTPACAGGGASSAVESVIGGIPFFGGVFQNAFRQGQEIGAGGQSFGEGIANALNPFSSLQGDGIPELGLAPTASVVERIVTLLVGLLLLVGGLALIAYELRGTVIGNAIGKVVPNAT